MYMYSRSSYVTRDYNASVVSTNPGSDKMRENTETIQYNRLAQIFGVYFTNESDRVDDTFV